MTKRVLIGAGVTVLAVAAALLVSDKAGWLDGLRDQNKVLRGRVEAYWQARVASDGDALEQFAHPLQKGSARSDMLVTDAYTIEGLEINGDSAIAAIRIRSHLKQPRLAGFVREAVIKNKWVRYQGQWYQDIGPTNIRDVLKDVQQRLHPEEVASSEGSTAPPANKGEAIDEEPRNN